MDLEVVSYSSLDKHRRCPQMWAYRYPRNLQQLNRGLEPALAFGTWWHALRAAHSIEIGRAAQSMKYIPATIKINDDLPELSTDSYGLPSDVLDAARQFDETLTDETREAWGSVLGGQRLDERLVHLNELWMARWGDEQLVPLAVEFPFEREIPGTGINLIGNVDLIAFDRKRKITIVRDYKTGSNVEIASQDDLIAPQTHLYAWGAAPDAKAWGYPIRALSYDRVRSTAPTPPKLTLTGALSKSVTSFDWLTYQQWAEGGVAWGEPDTFVKTGKNAGKPKFGTYELDPQYLEDLMAPAELAKWVNRTLTPANPNVIRAHLRDIVADITNIRATLERVERTGGEAGRHFSKACQWCEFYQLCTAELVGGPGGNYPLAEMGLE